MKTIALWNNGNRSVAVVEYPDQSIHAESGVFDGVKWQWRRIGTYASVKNATRRARQEIKNISEGWTKSPTWIQEI
jgi:hypothetical protein